MLKGSMWCSARYTKTVQSKVGTKAQRMRYTSIIDEAEGKMDSTRNDTANCMARWPTANSAT